MTVQEHKHSMYTLFALHIECINYSHHTTYDKCKLLKINHLIISIHCKAIMEMLILSIER